MLEMTEEFDKRLIYMWKTYMCGKWLKYLRNGKNNGKMTYICVKWFKYVGKCLNYLTNGLKMWKIMWEMAKKFGKWLNCIVHGLSI